MLASLCPCCVSMWLHCTEGHTRETDVVVKAEEHACSQTVLHVLNGLCYLPYNSVSMKASCSEISVITRVAARSDALLKQTRCFSNGSGAMQYRHSKL